MTTLVAFVVELVVSVVQLAETFVFEVFLTDPLSAISLLVGFGLVGGASAVLGYLTLGALGEWLGGLTGSPGGGPPRRD